MASISLRNRADSEQSFVRQEESACRHLLWSAHLGSSSQHQHQSSSTASAAEAGKRLLAKLSSSLLQANVTGFQGKKGELPLPYPLIEHQLVKSRLDRQQTSENKRENRCRDENPERELMCRAITGPGEKGAI